jgi:hypothetical protein
MQARDRQILQQSLGKELAVRARTYRAASEAYECIRAEFQGMLNNYDGASAVYRAARNECLALREYRRVLRELLALILEERSDDKQSADSGQDPTKITGR